MNLLIIWNVLYVQESWHALALIITSWRTRCQASLIEPRNVLKTLLLKWNRTHTFPPQGINSIKQVSSSSLPRNESLSSRQYRVLCLCQTANWLISLQRGKPQKCIKRGNLVWFQQYSQHSPSDITTSTVLIPVHWYKHIFYAKRFA